MRIYLIEKWPDMALFTGIGVAAYFIHEFRTYGPESNPDFSLYRLTKAWIQKKTGMYSMYIHSLTLRLNIFLLLRSGEVEARVCVWCLSWWSEYIYLYTSSLHSNMVQLMQERINPHVRCSILFYTTSTLLLFLLDF